ncbi:hypothetical protein CEV08_04125 [Bartonella tribocorum]|uniref:Uncharacterized protein n=1 Tax=Bartonella tribocorum TaxID=85701 RepID=A0A2M6UW69_9HYPH|nr:hypothetical protein CEV08_04125 [Bartonella tribocorum]
MTKNTFYEPFQVLKYCYIGESKYNGGVFFFTSVKIWAQWLYGYSRCKMGLGARCFKKTRELATKVPWA